MKTTKYLPGECSGDFFCPRNFWSIGNALIFPNKCAQSCKYFLAFLLFSYLYVCLTWFEAQFKIKKIHKTDEAYAFKLNFQWSMPFYCGGSHTHLSQQANDIRKNGTRGNRSFSGPVFHKL